MRVGQQVRYKGKPATIVAVTGSGPSGYKTLTLDVAGKLVEDVPHARDAAGKGYWDAHAVPDTADATVPAPVVPEAQAKGRATAGVGRKRKTKK